MIKNIKYACILLSICAVCAFALALTNTITAPVIAQAEAENRIRALEAVSGGFEIGIQNDVSGHNFVTYTIDLLQDGEIAGYIIGLRTSGYGGQMLMVASYDKEGGMLFAQLLSHSETPGLGKKAEEPSYMDKFKGTGSNRAVPTSKDQLSSSDAQAVSGSSITFTAIARAIAAGSEFVKSLGGAQ
jgi:electron transport complex protein RnfG